MRIVKVFLTLVFAVALGFIIHNNWGWLTRSEPVVVFTYSYDKVPAPHAETETSGAPAEKKTMEYRLQTVSLPIWIYMVGALVFGALFVLIGAVRDVYISRRDKKQALAELEEYKSRYGESQAQPSPQAARGGSPYSFDDAK